MPYIDDFICDKCSLVLSRGWGGYMYVEDDTGKRRPCPHPAEDAMVYLVLGKNASKKLIKERTGFNSYCICLDCLQRFELDLGEQKLLHYLHIFKKTKDSRKCSKCGSTNIKTVLEMVGKKCPKCKEGTIKRRNVGIC